MASDWLRSNNGELHRRKLPGHGPMKVQPYEDSRASEWNNFVVYSKNGTFLFDRSYMDYHRDRFVDASQMIYDKSGHLVAVLPANHRAGVVSSHGGLTYGGLVIDSSLGLAEYLNVFEALCARLRDLGFEALEYKVTPFIYHKWPADEDKYALFLLGAQLVRRDVSSAILPAKRLPLRKGRRWVLNRSIKAGLRVEESERWAEFWDILSENLHAKHGLKPVHSLAEIELLRRRFPQNIRLFTTSSGTDVLAGGVFYDTPEVTHAQYLGCSEIGRKMGALDILIEHVLSSVCQRKGWFNFGISTTAGGWFINRGLADFKEGFGARTVVQDSYRVDLRTADLSALRADRKPV